MTTAKELADIIAVIREVITEAQRAGNRWTRNTLCDVVDRLDAMRPTYRPPQPSDDGKWCYLEELPSDAPPTLVRFCGKSVREIVTADDVRLDYVPSYQFWTTAGWRELTGNVWPCERPEAKT